MSVCTKCSVEINVNGNVIADDIKMEHKREKEQIKASFYRSLEEIKQEFANEITLTTETMQAKHKKEMGEESITLIINYKLVIYTHSHFHSIFFFPPFLEEQWKQLVHEKESALQAAENRLRIKLEDADNKLRWVKFCSF